MGFKTSRASFLRGNRSGHHNTGLKRHVIGKKIIGGENSSCSTSGTCHDTLVKNRAPSHERGKDGWLMTMTNRTYPCSSVTRIFHNG